ncbi:hypothetical protein DSO57_1022092, partial [Entomophthora muscae]
YNLHRHGLGKSACYKERQNEIISWVNKLIEKRKTVTTDHFPTSDQTQEQHISCLDHKACTNNKHYLWETLEAVCALTNQLYHDLEDNNAQIAALNHKLDAYSKHLDLLASTTLLMEGNQRNLVEKLKSNNAARQEFEANISTKLSRLKQAMLSDNSLSLLCSEAHHRHTTENPNLRIGFIITLS